MKRHRDHHGFNRVRAAGKIAPLLSWRHLRELPWLFRICFLLIGIAVVLLVLALMILPLAMIMLSEPR
ncbi:MAG: hypothetical protein AB8C95_03190 [Phycisphaeraceae bacterium]